MNRVPFRSRFRPSIFLFLLRTLMLGVISVLCALLPPAFLMAWRPSTPIQTLALGAVLGLLTELMLFLFLFLHAASFVERLYRLPKGSGVGFVLRSLLSPASETPIGHAQDGDLTAATKGSVLARVGGPGTLVVHEGALVLLERGGIFTRLLGPGAHPLGRFERPALVLDLRPQARRRRVRAWTRDGIPVQTTLYLSGRLRWPPEGPTDEARWIRMAYGLDLGHREQGYGVDWAGALADEARVALARRLGQLWFDALWSPYPAPRPEPQGPPAPGWPARQDAALPPPRIAGEAPPDEGFLEPWAIPERPPADAPLPARWEEIRRDVQRELEKQARDWGVEILSFAFEPPVPWPEVEPLIREAWLEHWRVPWRRWAVHLRSRAVREQLRQRELARAMGQRELLEAIAAVVQQERPLEDPERGMQRLLLRLAELVRHWAHPEAAYFSPTDLIELFHHLRRMLTLPQPPSEGGSGGRGSPPPFPSDPGFE